jgi:hypothetical protein
MKYDAFISYSQRDDSRIAIALHDNLHRLAKRWDSLGSIRVFRDVTNLPVTSLRPALVQALANSRFLILLASPRSASSMWVHEEVARFLETHPPERVLIVLIGGELVWDESQGGFASGPMSAFPHVSSFLFAEQPLFLDLRWSTSEANLSLSNPRFLDTVATLAATLCDVPKETLVGDLVEEHRQLRRNQRINLGFRGAFGFGVAALFFMFGATIDFGLYDSISPETIRYLYFAIGFPAIGAFGALCGGLGWRGALGFAVGFLMLLPFFIASSLRPYESSLPDYIALAAISLAGFAGAGALGAIGCLKISWTDGAKAFGICGAIVTLYWLVFGAVRPDGIQTSLVAWPWLPTRFWLLGQRALAIVANNDPRATAGMLIPLILGVLAGGLLLGVRLADAQTIMPEGGGAPATATAGWLGWLWKILPAGRTITALLVLGIAVWSFSLRDKYETADATRVLSVDNFRSLLTNGNDSKDSAVRGMAISLALRTRSALERHGEPAAAEKMSSFIHETVEDFARTPWRWFENYDPLGKKSLDIGDIAQTLKSEGQPDELVHFLEAVHDHLKEADDASKIAAARTEIAFGSPERAEEVLRSVSIKDGPQNWGDRSLLAKAFFELGHGDIAKEMLRKLGNEIIADYIKNADLPRMPDERVAQIGNILVRTGLWNELPKLREEGGVLASAIEEMCRRGERANAVAFIRDNRENTRLWHMRARFARAAAESQQYDTAFAVLDAFEPKGSPDWTHYEDATEALSEIIGAAAAHSDSRIVQQAVTLLKTVERAVRERSLLDGFTGAKIAKAYALAGAYDAAHRIAKDMTNERWRAELAIGNALSAAGRGSEAVSMLAKAWGEPSGRYCISPVPIE